MLFVSFTYLADISTRLNHYAAKLLNSG